MRYFLLMIAVVALVGCGKKTTTDKVDGQSMNPSVGKNKECYWCKESIKAGALICKHCGKNPSEPLIENAVVEKAIRKLLKKPDAFLRKPTQDEKRAAKGELTKADLARVGYLDLAFTQITDAGLKDVAKLHKLLAIDLTNTEITDAGLKELAKLQQLGDLSLSFTKITKAGVAELKKALPRCRIFSHPKN